MTRRILILVVVVIAALAVAAVYGGWFRKDSGLQGSGTVDAWNIRVGSKVGGRILEVRVREGDHVQPGQTLITFDDKELEASLAQARANAQKSARGFRSEEIQEAAAAAKQAKADYDMHVAGYRTEDIDAAKADLDRATADETRAHLDFQRYDALAKKDLSSKQQRDTAQANWKIALAAKENAQHKLDELQRGFRPEEIAMAQARYQQAQATLEKMQHGDRREDVQATSGGPPYEEARLRERQGRGPGAATGHGLHGRPRGLPPAD